MKMRTALCMLVLSFFFGARANSQEEPRGKSIIVLDASGSMWGQINGEAKIDIAKRVVSDLLSTLDPSLELGLVAYGHRRKGDCTDIESLWV
jgi:Ca-activated chloride channel family protein